jgi:hypothetical protein
MKIWYAPGDGSCFFHSMEHVTGLQDLRSLVVKILSDKKDDDFNGLKLSEWIFFETGWNVAEYISKMRHRAWAGALEMKLLADYLERHIAVYKRIPNEQRAHLITVVESKSPVKKTVSLLYSNAHYDALCD